MLHTNQDKARLTTVNQWLTNRRKKHIWLVRFDWHKIKNDFLTALQNGTYQLKPMLQAEESGVIMWSALDALALKWG